MRIIIAIIISCIFMSGTSFAHVDRIIKVNEDGSLEGLPSKYGPAILRVEFAPQNAASHPITSMTLKLRKKQVRIPICVTSMLQTQRMSEIKASASWYHSEKILPYYLKVDFFDPGYDETRWANSGFSLLFNLRSGKLMQMEAIIVRDNGRSIQNVPVDITARCRSKELREFAGDAL